MEYPEFKNNFDNQDGFNIKSLIITISILALILYGLFNARNLLMGPSVTIFNPISEEIETKQNTVIIKGQAKNVVYISINERPILISPEGLFEEKLLLSEGSNIIEIKAKDRFKKEIVKQMKIYYKETSSSTKESLL
jgi:hypothetical protein